MRSRTRLIAFVAACVLGAASGARAQADADPAEAARFRLGPVRFTPSLSLSNIGIDSNVFNEFENARRDTTAAAGPAVDYWLKLGGARLIGKSAGQYLYFRQYDNQRAWNTINDLRLEVPLARITPFAIGSHANTKNRPGFEIDSRARLRNTTLGGGANVRLSGKTALVVSGNRQTFSFDDEESFLGAELSQFLNRRSDTESVHLRMQLTPLTTFVVRGEAIQDRFDFASDRDADSYAVMPGFELRPAALISGQVFVGIRRFSTLSDTVPDFTGVVANVDAKYVLRSTQFQVRVARDLTYSYQALQPYYALTDAGLTVTQRITSKWDVVGRGARQTLAYRSVAGTSADQANRADYSWQYGGGIGYRVGEYFRLGLDALYLRRESALFDFRNYEGLRVGASITYGLPQ
jgi:hypothetical protein